MRVLGDGPARPVMGLDLSLTATGIACTTHTDTLRTRVRKGIDRIDWLRTEILEHLNEHPLVIVEGYAMGTSRQAGSYGLGELGGLIRWTLWTHDIAWVDVPPATLKLFATGKGNAAKDAVLTAAVRAGADLDDNNAADAWWLRQLGLYLTTGSDVPRTAYRDRAVTPLTVPEGTAA